MPVQASEMSHITHDQARGIQNEAMAQLNNANQCVAHSSTPESVEGMAKKFEEAPHTQKGSALKDIKCFFTELKAAIVKLIKDTFMSCTAEQKELDAELKRLDEMQEMDEWNLENSPMDKQVLAEKLREAVEKKEWPMRSDDLYTPKEEKPKSRFNFKSPVIELVTPSKPKFEREPSVSVNDLKEAAVKLKSEKQTVEMERNLQESAVMSMYEEPTPSILRELNPEDRLCFEIFGQQINDHTSPEETAQALVNLLGNSSMLEEDFMQALYMVSQSCVLKSHDTGNTADNFLKQSQTILHDAVSVLSDKETSQAYSHMITDRNLNFMSSLRLLDTALTHQTDENALTSVMPAAMFVMASQVVNVLADRIGEAGGAKTWDQLFQPKHNIKSYADLSNRQRAALGTLGYGHKQFGE